MANCEIVEGKLDPVARKLVSEWTLPAGHRKPLWQYELLKDGIVLLRVEDFCVYMVQASPEDLIDFRESGVDTSLWEPISFQAQDGVKPEPFTDEDLHQLRQDLEQSE